MDKPIASVPLLEVAVGILIRQLPGKDREALYAQRLPGKPYAGWWEFPGGKRESGESMVDALRRELQEELGITVKRASPWVLIEHTYPHATVQLHFFLIDQWDGSPAGVEQQTLSWQPIQGLKLLALEPVLPASEAVILWLSHPESISFRCTRGHELSSEVLPGLGLWCSSWEDLASNSVTEQATKAQWFVVPTHLTARANFPMRRPVYRATQLSTIDQSSDGTAVAVRDWQTV